MVDVFIRRAGVDVSCTTARAGTVDIPGVKHERSLEAPLLVKAEATQQRSLVALLNHIAQDRPDLPWRRQSAPTCKIAVGSGTRTALPVQKDRCKLLIYLLLHYSC